jgi:hypothetical protein
LFFAIVCFWRLAVAGTATNSLKFQIDALRRTMAGLFVSHFANPELVEGILCQSVPFYSQPANTLGVGDKVVWWMSNGHSHL